MPNFGQRSMRRIFCHRCGGEVPGLEESEYAELLALWKAACAEERRAHGDVDIWSLTRIARQSPHFETVRTRYTEITGEEMMTRCMDFFHRLSSVGPACPKCGKEL